jgi:putative DNA primase/helicase
MPEQLTPEVIDQTPDVTLADVTDQDTLLAELASLSPIDYDRRRESAAKLLGIRVSTLDAEVAAKRSKLEEQHVTEQFAAATPEPWTDAVDGASLLDNLASFYTRFVVLPEGAADMLALWTLHTYAIDAFVITPRLAVVSPQKRCGKTTVMELLDAAACGTLSAVNISTAALFRAIEQWRPTMLIDEADTFLPDNEELRGVLNAGYRRPTAYVVRSVPVEDSWEPRKFFVFGPVAIAMIGKLPSTLADRSLHLRLRRKAKHEQVERLRLDRIGDITEALKRRCLRWAQDHLAQLKASDPAVPETLNDRAADNWRPLCAIAEVASGEWPERVKKAIAALAGTDMDDDAIGVMLLEDIRQIFEGQPDANIFSETLVNTLHTIEERPWSEWGRHRKPLSKTQLAGLLRDFDIRPKTVRVEQSEAKGYARADFTDAWSRYLSPLPVESAPRSVTPSQGSNDAGVSASQTVTSPDPRSVTPLQVSNDAGVSASTPLQSRSGASVTDQDMRNPVSTKDCNGVTDRGVKNVTDQNLRTPASTKGCNGVTDQSAENGEREKNKAIQAGDWCYLLSVDGVQQNVEPYLIASIETGPDGQQYARFDETDAGWLLAQCERTDPRAPAALPDDVEDY